VAVCLVVVRVLGPALFRHRRVTIWRLLTIYRAMAAVITSIRPPTRFICPHLQAHACSLSCKVICFTVLVVGTSDPSTDGRHPGGGPSFCSWRRPPLLIEVRRCWDHLFVHLTLCLGLELATTRQQKSVCIEATACLLM
jgi:hypothetical protein